MNTGLTNLLENLTESIQLWMKSDLVSLVFYPSLESEDPNYYFLLILKSNPDHYDIDFWIRYYQIVESRWDADWIAIQPDEKIPILSITMRSLDSCEKKQMISVTKDQSYEILYDTEKFYENLHQALVWEEGGAFNPDGDIIWI